QLYYTLEEAASKLGMSPGEFREVAQRKQVLSFWDQEGLRYRAQDIDRLAQEREPDISYLLTPSEDRTETALSLTPSPGRAMPRYCTQEEAARQLGLSADRFRALARQKQLAAFRDRGTLRYRAADIDQLSQEIDQ